MGFDQRPYGGPIAAGLNRLRADEARVEAADQIPGTGGDGRAHLGRLTGRQRNLSPLIGDIGWFAGGDGNRSKE